MFVRNRKKFSSGKRFLTLGAILSIVLILVFAFAISAGAEDAGSQGSFSSGANSSAPIVVEAEHFDVSPPLWQLAGEPAPPTGEITEMPYVRSPLVASHTGANGVDPVVQGAFGPGNIPTPIENFEGINNIAGVYPPDPNGDVGPNHFVEMVNVSYAVYNKSGGLLLGPSNINTIWAGFGGPCQNDNSGDPVVLYDPLADRWLLSQFAVTTGSHQCVAISQTADPTGAYYRYGFNIGGFPDYPKMGVWDNSYLATFRNFGAVFDMQAAAFNRAKMLAGDGSAEMVIFSISGALAPLAVDGFLPVDLDGVAPPAGEPAIYGGYLADEFGYAHDYFALFELDVDWANPGGATFAGPLLLPTEPFDPDLCGGSRDCIPQPGTSQGLDTLNNATMFRLAYRNFGFYQGMVANHSVDVGNDHAGVRWYELRDAGNGWGIYQQGTFAPDDENRWMGSIAMDEVGNIGLGYSVSSDTVFPSIRYTGRLVTDPLGQMAQGEGEIIAGSGSQTGTAGRWGDYTSMSVDPVDECTFWYTNEYIETTGTAPWQTRIASFKFAECPTPPMADFALWSQPAEQDICVPDDAVFDISVFEIGDLTDTVSLAANGVPTGYDAAFSVNPVTPPDNSVMTLSNTGAATAGSYDVVVEGTAPGLTHATTVTLNLFTDVPTAPSLNSPPDGALGQSFRPILEWDVAPLTTGYFVEVAADAAFTMIVDSATVTGNSYQVGVQLDPETTYYWRVTSENACGAGATSEEFSFTTIGDQVVCSDGSDPILIFGDDFDPADPAWTHSGNPDTWILDMSRPSPGSGGNAWMAQDSAAPNDQHLISPEFALPDESQLFLQFYNEQDFEDPAGSGGCWDGGLLEISTDSGTNWTQLDDELLTDPYDGVGNNGPPAGLNMWCGDIAGFQAWLNSIVDLNGFAGETVQFRFRALSDAAAGAPGWWIDDFVVTYCEEPIIPEITMQKTVGTEAGVCATTDTIEVVNGETVYYCYEVTNTGNVTLSLHDLDDDQLGQLLNDFAFDLAPGATVSTVDAGATFSATITADTTNTAVWTAFNADGTTATSTDTATVTTREPTDVSLSSLSDVRTNIIWPVAALLLLAVFLGLLFWRRRENMVS